jgi:hypothetical protein
MFFIIMKYEEICGKIFPNPTLGKSDLGDLRCAEALLVHRTAAFSFEVLQLTCQILDQAPHSNIN